MHRLGTSPRIPAREILLVAFGALVLVLISHWPLPAHMSSAFSRDLGDPIVQAWQVAWGGQALATQPFSYFQANMFWPLPDSLAFSDALVGYAPTGLIGEGVRATTFRYNALFLFSYWLAFMGAYLLARELGVKWWAAVVAGTAFAFAPWRLEQDGHLHILSSGGIPLSLYLLVRGYRRDCPWSVLAGWLVAAWQVSLGFSLGLQLGYLVGVIGFGALLIWVQEKSPRWFSKRVMVATIAGLAITLVTAVTLALPYMRVLDNHPEAQRSAIGLAEASPPAQAFLAASPNNMVWGDATSGIREAHLTSTAEQSLFPGLLIFGFAIAGLCLAGPFSKRLRVSLGAAALALMILSLGFRSHGLLSVMPYRWLYELAPGWQGVRTPGRLNTLTSLALALLAAAGAHAVLSRVNRRGLAVALAMVLALGIYIEGLGFKLNPKSGGVLAGSVTPRAPLEPKGQTGIAEPQLHLPITIAANRRYVYWSTNGFPKIANGRGSVDPQFFTDLTYLVRDFPNEESVSVLRQFGYRTVVLHPYLLARTAWEGSERQSIAGLGITRRRQGDLVVYELNP